MGKPNENLRIVDATELVKIESAAEWRALLMNAAIALLDQKLTVPMSNALVGLSAEVHKSIKQEFDMRCYVAGNIVLEDGKVMRLSQPNA